MNQLKSFLKVKYILWLTLSIPGILTTINYLTGKLTYDMIMHITGEFSGRMLVISLIATPLTLMFPKGKVTWWIVRNRRFFGVSAFAYALLHATLYFIEYPINQFFSEFAHLPIVAGWIAFFVLVPLAITSTNTAIKRMGPAWKKLQRWVYLAAVMAFAHWALIGVQGEQASMGGAIAHFVPVMLLQGYRVWKKRG